METNKERKKERNELKPGVLSYLDTLSAFGLENVTQDYSRKGYYGDKITKTCIGHIVTRISNLNTLSGVIKLADHYIPVLLSLGEDILQNPTA